MNNSRTNQIPIMAKLTVRQIRDLAKKIVLATPAGIRYRDLVQRIAADGGRDVGFSEFTVALRGRRC
jgi:hypothetical protein